MMPKTTATAVKVTGAIGSADGTCPRCALCSSWTMVATQPRNATIETTQMREHDVRHRLPRLPGPEPGGASQLPA